MTDMPPGTGPLPAGRDIDPATTALLKIVGVMMLAPTPLLLLAFVLVAIVDPRIVGSMVRDPLMVFYYLFAATGLGLLLYARRRDRLYRQDWEARHDRRNLDS